MTDELMVLGFALVIVINLVQGYWEQKAQSAKVDARERARGRTVLGSEPLGLAYDSPTKVVEGEVITVERSTTSLPVKTLGLARLNPGVTSDAVDRSPNGAEFWSDASVMLDAVPEALDSIEPVDRGTLKVYDLDVDPVIALPARDPIEIS
jgi:hypothetical protein